MVSLVSHPFRGSQVLDQEWSQGEERHEDAARSFQLNLSRAVSGPASGRRPGAYIGSADSLFECEVKKKVRSEIPELVFFQCGYWLPANAVNFMRLDGLVHLWRIEA